MNTKNLLYVLLLALSGLPMHATSVAETYAKNKNLYLVDTIKVVIYSEDGADIVTQSESERPGIDGTFRSLDDVVFERLMYLDAKRFKMLPDEEAIDKNLQAVQKENNLNPEQLKNVFKQAGYTFEEGRMEFARMTAVGSMLEFRIRSRLIVPEREVVAYYNEHPVMEPASYYIERAVVPVEGDEATFEERLKKFIVGKHSMAIVWSAPFWINEADLAEDKQFITTMKEGSISDPHKIAEGFELFHLKQAKPERPVPLEARYREIANILRKPRYDFLMEDYKKNLFNASSIIYFDEADKKVK